MKGKRSVAAASLTVGLAFAGSGAAGNAPNTTTNVRAALSAAQLVPRPTGANTRAAGAFTGHVLRIGKAGGYLTWRLTFRGLSGRPTAAELHLAVRGKSGPFALLLCKSCRSGQQTKSALSPITARAIMSNGAYVVVATRKHPRGEIRGQLIHGPIVTG